MTFPTEEQAREFLAQNKMSALVVPTTHKQWVYVSGDALDRTANICVICGGEFPEYPNNPDPVAEGVCCSFCDDHVVTPARLRRRSSLE
jgi:hypothetical protein